MKMRACRITGLSVEGEPLVCFHHVAECEIIDAVAAIKHTPGVANLVGGEVGFSSKGDFIMPLPMVLARAIWREADEAGLPF